MFFLPAFLLAGIAAVFVVWLGTFIWQIFLSKADNPWLLIAGEMNSQHTKSLRILRNAFHLNVS